jgi:hypothetical protein
LTNEGRTVAKGYVGWALDDPERSRLLTYFRPVYPDIYAHHVTLAFGVSEDYPLPETTRGAIIGIADDRRAIQALVVEIGETIKRPDGNIFHLTWSLDRSMGARPMHSNDVIRSRGWDTVPRFSFRLRPAFFPF